MCATTTKKTPQLLHKEKHKLAECNSYMYSNNKVMSAWRLCMQFLMYERISFFHITNCYHLETLCT